jgi:hypothetical protein
MYSEYFLDMHSCRCIFQLHLKAELERNITPFEISRFIKGQMPAVDVDGEFTYKNQFRRENAYSNKKLEDTKPLGVEYYIFAPLEYVRVEI